MVITGYFQRRSYILFSWALFFMVAPAAWADTTHVVKKGESLSFISQKYRVPISQIKEANDLKDTRLQIGQPLTIPQQAAAVSTRSSPPKGRLPNSSPDQEIPDTYVVKDGDTLTRIAKRYHLSVEELQEINELKGTRLKVGQVLHLKREEEEILGEIEKGAEEGNFEHVAASKEMQQIPISQAADRMEEKDPDTPVTIAQGLLGVKYRRGGTSLTSGVDCSAFVQKVFQILGVDLPRTAREQFGLGFEVARDALRLGDLVFFKHSKTRRPAHVGIYIGNDQFIHTSLSKRRVRVDSLSTRYFATRFIGGRRIQEVQRQPDQEKPKIDDLQFAGFSYEPIMSLPLLASSPSPVLYPDPDL